MNKMYKLVLRNINAQEIYNEVKYFCFMQCCGGGVLKNIRQKRVKSKNQ